ncbi:MAG: FIST C-terminal domain-containing protein [Ferruginibacter sp.]
MQTALYSYKKTGIVKHPLSNLDREEEAGLVLCFGAKNMLAETDVYAMLQQQFPQALIATCSTAGEIYHTSVEDDTLAVTAVKFDHTRVVPESVNSSAFASSYDAGQALINQFDKKDLVHVFVLSDGSTVNGSELVQGMNDAAGKGILVTGGLAGDGSNFQSTLVGLNCKPQPGLIAAIGFYGSRLKVTHGSRGGWETFGLEKEVTASEKNILFEIENRNALDLYKQYLGAEANGLPGAALLFPLSVILPGQTEPVVRTILSIDDTKGAMTFAGDIPTGSRVRLMRANFDKITTAASEAAEQTMLHNNSFPGLAILISCVGRKLILKSRVEEETEVVDEMYDHKTILTGFYSYGELSPLVHGGTCQLQNQTMTITTFYES